MLGSPSSTQWETFSSGRMSACSPLEELHALHELHELHELAFIERPARRSLKVLNPLLYQSQLSHSLQARLASCRILGKVAHKFDTHMVKTELLPLARSLCQDQDSEVRGCMCRQLESISRATGVEDTRTELLPELVELARDEESSVRLAAFDTIINLMDMMGAEDRLHIVVPMVMSVCEVSWQADEGAMASLSFQFGKVCSGLAGSLSDEERGRLLQRFKVLCVAGLQTEGCPAESTLVRCHCCYNLPAMVVFADSVHFLPELYPSFSSLCCDPQVSVRRSAAASFHQVVKLLGSDAQLVYKELVALLQDEALEVLDALVNHLEETLEAVLSRGENLVLDNKFPELLSALLLAEQKVGFSLRWRLHEKLLQRYSCLARLLPGKLLHQNFSLRIFTILTTNKVLPVQREAARTFCTFLRYNRKHEQRQEMMERLIQDLAQGRSYWNRLRFLDVCETASEIFSRKYFNKYFLIPALELVHDPVANVRYKLCQLLPRLRSSLRLPADKQLLQQLDFCVQKLLCREKDKDVVASIRKFHKRQERDLLDQKKEKEENLLLEMQQLERQQSEGKLNERKRRDSKTSLSICVPGATAASSVPRSAHLIVEPDSSSRKVKELSSMSGPGKTPMSLIKATQSTSSMPVLIRSNTISLLDRASTLDHRTSSLDQRDHITSTLPHRTCQMDRRNNMMEQRTMDHRTSATDQRDHRTLDQRDHRISTMDQRSKTMDRGCRVKDGQSRKLSM
ncbi:Serine/threonine-protein phosphatase 4 regulatory subunit 4 [Liparis tanakae]|uniref:Serine/threonine-protein phosphatase 4 regulatory subunit 4 n=1 Tax=Liparis tanakae TaxID=230148 RepID=A0A4Z2FVF7_9TELE|nr:Serine/threonine-protein phosphatase 4 regulatory subunit 4 [Liparis tanakae]